MLDYLAIFTKGGAILWTFGQLLNVQGHAIDTLVATYLLEDRIGEDTFVYRPPNGTACAMRWVLDNSLDLVFVAVYQQLLAVPYAMSLLNALKGEFRKVYEPALFHYPEFDAVYKQVLRRVEAQSVSSKMRLQGRSNGAAAHGDSQGHARGGNGSIPTDNSADEPDSSADALAGSDANANSTQAGFDREALLKKVGARKGKDTKRVPAKPSGRKDSKGSQKGKKPRKWGAGSASDEDLDYSRPSDATADHNSADPTAAGAERSRMSAAKAVTYDDDDAALAAELKGGQGASEGVLGGLLASLKTRIAGKEALTRADTDAAMAAIKKRLQERNVSSGVAERLCASVAATLEGRRLASFTGVSALVRDAMEQAITRILSPKRAVDVLADVRAARARGKPYSIVFVGVNGVGKSTNLAKVAFWLRQQNLRVMIAACDTFRSGAVEQLKTHCGRLGVPLFDRGYDKDPTNVAAEAIRQAGRDGIDVVLVDTAGRMQDNEPLMQALSMLINKNSPDLVLFVGEALVGNDGVNQLVKFNERLADLSPVGAAPRLIDGVLVTKFDAIDDKVGAVLSMAYCSGAPIVFVGCGQTYVDLMKLDVRAVVKSLLK